MALTRILHVSYPEFEPTYYRIAASRFGRWWNEQIIGWRELYLFTKNMRQHQFSRCTTVTVPIQLTVDKTPGHVYSRVRITLDF